MCMYNHHFLLLLSSSKLTFWIDCLRVLTVNYLKEEEEEEEEPMFSLFEPLNRMWI